MGGHVYDNDFEGAFDDDAGTPPPPTLTGLPAWADTMVWLAIIAAFAWLGFRQGSAGTAPRPTAVRVGAPSRLPRDEHGFRESDLETIAKQYAEQVLAPPGPARFRGTGAAATQ